LIKIFREKLFLIFSDFVTLNLSFLLLFWVKFHSGVIDHAAQIPLKLYLIPFLILYIYWVIVFSVAGMYRSWYRLSRLDEVITIFKSIIIGMVLFYFILFFSGLGHHSISRSILIIYISSLIVFVSLGRMIVRNIQRKLLVNGIGVRRIIVVGINDEAVRISHDILKRPALGLRFMGFIDYKEQETLGRKELNILGNLNELSRIIKKNKIEDVIFALHHEDRDHIFEIMNQIQDLSVDFYIIPELYDIVAGHLKTNQIYGFPLVKLFPSLMTPFEEKTKRFIDISLSLLGLMLSSPLLLIVMIIIKIDSPGPLIFKQERSGKNGKLFKVLKFRSMVANAEKKTGPVWASKNDARITRFGNFMRKTRIDEIPQFINILKNEMSLVGPRPERPFFVEKFKKEIPLYANRLKVKPGLTGYAQVKHKYDASLEDVKEKLKYDLYYIENMSLRLDLKIMLRTVWVILFPGDKVH